MAMSECCIKGFEWGGQPIGKESKLANNNAYVTGSNPDVAIMVISDLFGWTFTNTRLLCDHYAKEADATVYMPDFFGGEVVSPHVLRDLVKGIAYFDLEAWHKRNAKDVRWPELLSCTQALRSQHNYKRVGVLGYCYGGWSVFRLGAAELNSSQQQPLVDCVSTAHPTWLTKEEIDAIAVPVQIISPEIDPAFTEELKAYANEVIPKKEVPYEYCFFPGLEHSFATRGNPENEKERRGMVRAKNAMVAWMREWLHGERIW